MNPMRIRPEVDDEADTLSVRVPRRDWFVPIEAVVFFALLSAAFAFILYACIGCTSLQAKEAAAEAGYVGQQLKCVDDEPDLPRDATNEQRRAANSRINACRRLVRERWGISETVTDAGADR